jgi:hypothetical protein
LPAVLTILFKLLLSCGAGVLCYLYGKSLQRNPPAWFVWGTILTFISLMFYPAWPFCIPLGLLVLMFVVVGAL